MSKCQNCNSIIKVLIKMMLGLVPLLYAQRLNYYCIGIYILYLGCYFIFNTLFYKSK